MSILRTFGGLSLALALTACGPGDMASRNSQIAPENMNAAPAEGSIKAAIPSLKLVGYDVSVPRSLRVSEANRYYPGSDIVWRVAAMFETALDRAEPLLDGDTPVRARIVVKRFHSVTEKTRYTIGGVHNIIFDLTIIDPATGAILVPTREVRADLEAFGGARAINAEHNGITQKYRVTNHLTRVFQVEMTAPEGYRNANLGWVQVLNNIK